MKLPRHSLRIRDADEWPIVAESPGALDGLVVNANVLEHRATVFARRVADSSLPFLIDPMLWRFQVPTWWMRDDGVTTKKNFVDLARRYSAGTGIHMGAQPLLDWVNTDDDWHKLAANVVKYQRNRLADAAGSLFVNTDFYTRQPVPAEIVAPYLLARNRNEDRINRLLIEGAAEAAGQPVIAHLALPLKRAQDPLERAAALQAVLCEEAGGVLIWMSGMTEERLMERTEDFDGFLAVLDSLNSHGKVIGHAHSGFAAAVLRDRGLHSLIHRVHWTDDGMPAEPGGGPAACTTYVTALHRAVYFDRAWPLIPKDPQEYLRQICSCFFCREAVAAGEHPMDLLMQAVEIRGPRGGTRLTPSDGAIMANRFHFLWSRRLEVQSIEELGPREYLHRELERLTSLGVPRGRLNRLAEVI